MSFALLGAEWVLWLLVAMSVLCIAISIERAWFLSRDSSDHASLGTAVNTFLGSGDKNAFDAKLEHISGVESRILKAGVEVCDLGPVAAEKAMSGTATAEKLRMERGLIVLATVGSNAPFIGLFGTVLGIMQAFHDLSLDTDDAESAVMAGISEALVATAIGLLVAIPAVVLYNAFTRAVRRRMGASASLADLVLARISGGVEAHGG
jgi:biopolymer transport protein ExbB